MPSRRTVITGIATSGTLTLAGCLSRSSAEPGTDESYEWPMIGVDLRNSRSLSDGRAPRESPTVDWHADLDSMLATGEPIITADTVIVPTGRDVVAFDRETSEQRWSIDPDNEAYSYLGSVLSDDELVYVPEQSTLTARDIETGAIEWSASFDRPIGRNALTLVGRGDDQSIYVAAGNELIALDTESGDRQWERTLFGRVRNGIASYADRLFVPTRGGDLYSVTLWGSFEWRRTIEAGIHSAPMVLTSSDRRVGQGIAVTTGDGAIAYFDWEGERGWRTDLGGQTVDGLAIAHRTVFARSRTTLFALDANDGSERWRVRPGGGIDSPPIVVGDTVYVGGDRLVAIDVDGGFGIRSIRFGDRRFDYVVDGTIPFVTAADGKLFVVTDVGTADRETAQLIVLS